MKNRDSNFFFSYSFSSDILIKEIKQWPDFWMASDIQILASLLLPGLRQIICQFDAVVRLELLVRICLLPFSGDKSVLFIYSFLCVYNGCEVTDKFKPLKQVESCMNASSWIRLV